MSSPFQQSQEEQEETPIDKNEGESILSVEQLFEMLLLKIENEVARKLAVAAKEDYEAFQKKSPERLKESLNKAFLESIEVKLKSSKKKETGRR